MEQIYVVTKEDAVYVKDVNGQWAYANPVILGFAARYDINSEKCNKKNAAQDDWGSYGVRTNSGCSTIWGWDYITQKMANIPYHPKAPLILDNIPVSGYIVADTVTRSSTSNKFWRILDPRGFQLEISTDNMLDIITNSDIAHGQLIGKYKWEFGKTGIGKAKLVAG